MTSQEIREKFLEFFEKRGHAVVPSSSLIPDDPSVLLTTAGMQQFKQYFTGELDPMKDFGSLNTVSVQKCFRTSDIDEVGDASHLTFFEMLGNFSFGGYFKEETIKYAHEFITKEMGLVIDCVSVFEGDATVPADEESEKIWKSLGVKNIKKAGREDNFWGTTGAEGPCGPTTEIYVETSAGESVEVWNIVFNEYYSKGGKLTPLKIKGVDTGMGLERLAMVSQGVETIFETDLFKPLMKLFSENVDIRTKRIIIDHVRGSIFLIADGVRPSNKLNGYVLRRLVRRILGYVQNNVIGETQLKKLISSVLDFYGMYYTRELENRGASIIGEFKEEEIKFENGISSIEKSKDFEHILDISKKRKLKNQIRGTVRKFVKLSGHPELYGITVDGKMVWRDKYDLEDIGNLIFDLYQSKGGQFEIIVDILRREGVMLSDEAVKELRRVFEEKFRGHQEISRAGVEKKFGGHGLVLDTGEIKAGSDEELQKVTRLHTATHLLNQALREVLGEGVMQRGSDITTERARFDFTFNRKMTPEEIKKVEEIVNEKINEDLPVNFKEMSKEEAEKTGALHFFKGKYPERVKVYYVGKSLEDAWNKEFCGGPHVSSTGEIGEFRITKEEASAAGVRRIRATVA